MLSHTERTTCRLCSGPLRELLRLADTPPANELVEAPGDGQETFPLYLSACLQCSHVQLPVIVPPARMFESYFYQSATSPVFRSHLSTLAHKLSANLFPSDLVVEIGSNDGTLLKHFVPPIRSLGIDPARNLAEKATKDGALTYPGFFDEAVAKSVRRSVGRARLIVGLNVFAHIGDAIGAANAVRELLTDDGELVLEVGYLPDVVATNNFPVVYHEHTDIWALRPMRRFYEARGLCLYDAERVDSQGGSIRAFVSKRTRATTDRLERLLGGEGSLDEKLATWQSRVDEARKNIGDAVRGLKAAGHTICGYGAAAKSTTLLHACGLGRAELDAIFDLNPLKIGKFTPGTHVPIVSPTELEARKPDYILMLSGNFSASIRSQHPEYRGKWIEPLPEVRVVDG
jgi:hypothetical protein